jgi:hypothetical protein
MKEYGSYLLLVGSNLRCNDGTGATAAKQQATGGNFGIMHRVSSFIEL